MAKNGDRGGPDFESRLSRTEVLLGLARTAGEEREETLKELHEQDIFWGDKEGEQNDSESDLFSTKQSRSKNYKGNSTCRNIFELGGKRLRESQVYQTCKSVPVNIHHWPHAKITESFVEDDDEMGVRPPHELVARDNENISFSVVEGNGRTLKGRDLRNLRDAIFRKTGFVE